MPHKRLASKDLILERLLALQSETTDDTVLEKLAAWNLRWRTRSMALALVSVAKEDGIASITGLELQARTGMTRSSVSKEVVSLMTRIPRDRMGGTVYDLAAAGLHVRDSAVRKAYFARLRLSPSARLLLAILLVDRRRTGKVGTFYRSRDLAARTGMSVRQIWYSIAKLELAGLVTRRPPHVSTKDLDTSCVRLTGRAASLSSEVAKTRGRRGDRRFVPRA